MIVGQRILARLEVVKISQSELARRVRMSQGAMANLIAGRSRSSTHLHKIARELETTPSYLVGETDDADKDAPLPAVPAPPIITMEVVLPPASSLKVMFKALLAGIDRGLPLDEQAQLLAERLPIGLGQLQYARTGTAKQVQETAVEDRAMLDPEPAK